ncbi:MAG TPA: aspartate kinase [Verrucomicrobiales bacterium]|jgi:aspartate kinase|nr:aspartate kinase [Verrucomicrobiales bacterium]
MATIVQKYGGTSVGNPERIKNVARRVLETQRAGNQVVVVVSAMSGVTDNLIKLAREVCDEPVEREMDVLLATGEQTTIALLAMAINHMGGNAISFTGAQAGIVTDHVHTKARISNISPGEVHRMLDDGNIVVLAGFQGHTVDGRITTLGRGGSDLTAIAMAAAIKADLCQIFTDVDGVYTADPRLVPDARKIPVISYEEMLEMASSGSKVMQSRSVEFANKFGVPFEVRNSMNHNPGTLVTQENMSMESVVIRGVSLEKDQAKITITSLPDQPGNAARVFKAIGDANLNIDMIIQNTGREGEARISFTLHKNDLKKARAVLEAAVKSISDKVEVSATDGIAKVSAVGIGMRSHSGVAAIMFGALGEAGINIDMISTSEIKIAVIVDEKDQENAVRTVHAAFKLHEGAEQ